MSNYCTLKEAWGSPPSTMDWNADIRSKRKKKSSSRNKKKQIEEDHLESETRNEPIVDPSHRSLLPYNDSDEVNGAPYQSQNYAPKIISKYSEGVPPPQQHAMHQTNGGDSDIDYNNENTESEEDNHQQPLCTQHPLPDDEAESSPQQQQQKQSLPSSISELEWLKNLVSYLLTKMDQLSTQLEQQQQTYTNVRSSSSASDILLFVVIGLFGILILDLFFRWGSSIR